MEVSINDKKIECESTIWVKVGDNEFRITQFNGGNSIIVEKNPSNGYPSIVPISKSEIQIA